MSNYDYDGAMDQIAEWEEEERMEKYYEEEFERYNTSLEEERNKLAEEEVTVNEYNDEASMENIMKKRWKSTEQR